MTLRRIILVAILAILPYLCSAQLYAMRDSVANSYDFWLYMPERRTIPTEHIKRDSTTCDTLQRDSVMAGHIACDTTREKIPVVVFLHGRSLCGSDIYRVRRYGTIDAVTRGLELNAAVIAPQNRGDGWWRPERIMRIVEWVSERYDVDTTRLYVLGMSLGGYGTIDFAATYPDRTAAAMALCGGSSLDSLAALSRVPLWIMHGTADRDVPVSASRRVRDAVTKADSCNLMRYDELKGIGHSLFARTFYLHEAYDWLFKHSTTDSARFVDRDVEITMARLNKPYTDLPKGGASIKVIDPKGTTAANIEEASGAEWHTIKSGDTLGHIARRYNTTVKRLCALNGINEKSILRIGKRLRVR